MTHQEFIDAIAVYVQKYAPEYGIKVISPIIAQAILESNWGESKLSAQYHNYFGLKCGTKWQGKSVNLRTQEEYSKGTLTSIRDNFRVYDSMEEGVKGYFDFIQLARYQNLRGITDPETYLKTIRADGYATSSSYVENNMKLIRQYDLTKYDAVSGSREEKTMAKTAETLIAQARAWIGCREADGSHKKIIDLYNSHKPLARGYKVKYTDAWCATFVSACAIKTGMTNIIPTECGCGEMIKLFKKLGEWDENDARVPRSGDIIFYDWQDSGSGDNIGEPDHVGIVESVSGNIITAIEGNYSDSVKRRTLKVNGRYIRGYGVPKYAASTTTAKPASNVGTTGTLIKKYTATTYASKRDDSLAGTYITTSDLYCRDGAGKTRMAMCIIPKGTPVKCYGYYSIDPDTGRKWLLVQFTLKNIQYTGFSSISFLKKS